MLIYIQLQLTPFSMTIVAVLNSILGIISFLITLNPSLKVLLLLGQIRSSWNLTRQIEDRQSNWEVHRRQN